MTCVVWKNQVSFGAPTTFAAPANEQERGRWMGEGMKCNPILHSPVYNAEFRSVSENRDD